MDKTPAGRSARVEQVATLLRAANAAGRKLKGTEVMAALGVSKPTAGSLLDDARKRIADQASAMPAVMATPMPDILVAATPGAAIAMAASLGVGIDLLGELETTLKHLNKLRDMAMADLEIVRFVLMGDRGGRPVPGMCTECRMARSEELDLRRPTLALISMEAKDLPKFYAEAARMLKGCTETLDTYNGVLEQFYNFVALEKTSRRYAQAIKNVAPEYSKAIAVEFRRLSQVGE